MIDHRSVSWDDVASATYRVEQSFDYNYPGPIHDLRHRLMIAPRDGHGDQRRLEQHLHVAPNVPAVSVGDVFGNDVWTLSARRVESNLRFDFESLVRRDTSSAAHYVQLAALRDPELGSVRRLTRSDEALEDAAADLRARYADPFELAEAINAYVNAAIIYTKDATDVFTTASVAFRMGRGVCQDYAHVMVAIARCCGLSARYVSGHMLGEGATHAWVEVLIPVDRFRAQAVAYDPTNGRRADIRYVVVAVGRDYDDVAPTSGAYVAPYSGVLRARTNVHVVDVEYAA